MHDVNMHEFNEHAADFLASIAQEPNNPPNAICGQCGDRIGDWWDDCGFFYKIVENPVVGAICEDPWPSVSFPGTINPSNPHYVAVCKTCCGPLTGDR